MKPRTITMIDHLIAARTNLNFARESLQSVLHECNAVEGIIILALIGEVAALHHKIDQIESAVRS